MDSHGYTLTLHASIFLEKPNYTYFSSLKGGNGRKIDILSVESPTFINGSPCRKEIFD